MRVTAGGLVPPKQVLVATYVAFGLAVLAGSYLIATAGWELLLVGAASILAGVLYTGGPRPYGYEGLGEVFVFLFFGVVAVTGSYFVQVERIEWEAFVLAVPVGLLASAILVVNNVRDLETDRRAGKRTLAVRLGRERTRVLYVAMVAGAFVTAQIPWLARLAVAVAAAGAARDPAGAAGGAGGADALRRAGAERRARRDGPAPARVLPPALGGHPGELMRLVDVRGSGCACASRCGLLGHALRAAAAAGPARGGGWARGPRRGGAAGAVRRGAARGGAGRARRVRRDGGRARRGRAARGLPGRARPAAGAGGGRPRAVGPRGPARRAAGGGADLGRGGALDPGQRDDRRRGPRGRRGCGGGRAQAGFDCVKVKVGIGDDAGRLAAVRAAVGPRVAIRVDANGAWEVEEAVASLRALAPWGSSWWRSRSTASRRCARCGPRSPCRWRWTRRPPRTGARRHRARRTRCA